MNLGQELKGLVRNVGDLVDSIAGIRAHVETGMGSLPVAAGKLEKVTGETESATQHLMDVLDGLNANDKEAAEILSKMASLPGSGAEMGAILGKLSEMVDKNQAAHMRMFEILQFQDLTAQQINHVNSLLEKIELELNAILGAFGETGGSAITAGKAFDESATYLRAPQAQAEVDSLIRDIKKGRA